MCGGAFWRGFQSPTCATNWGLHATQYYNWQKQLFENAASAFERRPNQANQRRQESAAARKIAQLEAKLQKKNEVVAELLEEHVQLEEFSRPRPTRRLPATYSS